MTPGNPNSMMQPAPAMPDIYPMPSFVTLTVQNVLGSVALYRDVLGFQVVMVFGAPGGATTFAHLRWTKFADLLLRAGTAGPCLGMTISYQTELDRVDALAERARAAGVKLLVEPGDRPWNTRDFTLSDLDGYPITFTAGPVDKNLNIRDISARSRSL